MPNLAETLSAIQLIGLIIITGGTLVMGALAAPTIFKNLSREEAGAVMVDLFGNFDKWIKFSAILLFGSKLIELIVVHKFNFMIESTVGEEVTKALNTGMLSSVALVLAILAISSFLAFKLSPQIVTSYENHGSDFEQLHKKSEVLHKVNFVLGFILLLSFAN